MSPRRPPSQALKIHWQDGDGRVLSIAGANYVPMFLRGVCGRGELLTRDRNAVTCQECLARLDQTHEDRRKVYEDERRRQKLRHRAKRIVLDRHADEVERELAALVAGGES